MLRYKLSLSKKTKTRRPKYILSLVFDNESEFSDSYRAVRKLTVEGTYNKKNFFFSLTANLENTVELIKLQHSGGEITYTDAAKELFDKFRNEALEEISLRQHETAIVKKLKSIGKLTKINVKSYTPKKSWYNHQKFLFLLATKVRKVFYMDDPGTGKTAPALHAVDYRHSLKQVRKCVVVVPNHLLYKWAEGEGNEIEKHTQNLTGMVLDGDKTTRLAKIRKFINSSCVTLITSYSFWSGRKTGRSTNRNDDEYALLFSNNNIDMYLIDESHKIKNPSAQVTKNITKWFKSCKYGILLTGTPQPNFLTDIFTQSRLVYPSAFGYDFFKFKNTYFIESGPFNNTLTIKSDRHKEVLFDKAEQRAIVYRTDECIDLPKAIEEIVSIRDNTDYLRELRRLSPEQVKTALTSGTKGLGVLRKLLIATCGFTYVKDAQGNRVAREFKTNPKAEALEELCETIVSSGKKAIIWHQWQHDAVIIKRLLKKNGYSYTQISKADDPKERHRKVKEYEKSDTTFLVCQTRILSQGVDILTPQYAIYYSYDYEFEPIIQSKARNRRLGSADLHDTIIYYFLCVKDSIEEDVIAALNTKMEYKTALFGMCRNMVNRIRQYRGKR